MAAVNGDLDDNNVWVEFCDKQARSAAVEFARQFRVFVSEHPSYIISNSGKDFAKKFVDYFLEHFEMEMHRKYGINNLGNDIKSIKPPDSHDGKNSSHDESDYSDTESPNVRSHKTFFRRLSFKGFKKGIFHKQHSDEVELSTHCHDKRLKHEKHEKTKLAKIIVECKKEGIVNYLSGEDLDGKQKWEKCRLALVKTTGGYMLEFYSPPKVW